MPPKALQNIKNGHKINPWARSAKATEEDIMRPPSCSSSSEEENLADIKPVLFDRNCGHGKGQRQAKVNGMARMAGSQENSGYGGVNSYLARKGIDTSNRIRNSKFSIKRDNQKLPALPGKSSEDIFGERNTGKKTYRAVYGRFHQSSSQSTAHSQPNSSQTSQSSPKKKLKYIELPSNSSDESEDETSPVFKPPSNCESEGDTLPIFKPPSNEFLEFMSLEDSESKCFTKSSKASAHSNFISSPISKRKFPSSLHATDKGDFSPPNFKISKTLHETPPSSFSEPSSSLKAFKQESADESVGNNPEVLFKAYDCFSLKGDYLTSSNPTELSPGKKTLDCQTGEHQTITTVSRCPMCYEPVSPGSIRTQGSMNTRQQAQFCLEHRKRSARKQWEMSGYPRIEWNTLDARISKHYKYLQKLINGEESFYRSLLQEKINKGKDRNLHTTTTNLIPGYYGPRGLRIISENLFRKFTPLLKKRIVQDRLMAARGYTPYVQSVLVPEVAALLIQEDMFSTLPEARDIMFESAAVGELLHEEVREDFIVTMKR